MKKLILGTAVSTLLLSFASFAQDHSGEGAEKEAYKVGQHRKNFKHRKHRRSQRMMEKVDSNEDGKIDLTEFLSHSEQRFQSMDDNSDGYVTAEEMHSWGKEMRIKHRKARMDARADAPEKEGAD